MFTKKSQTRGRHHFSEGNKNATLGQCLAFSRGSFLKSSVRGRGDDRETSVTFKFVKIK